MRQQNRKAWSAMLVALAGAVMSFAALAQTTATPPADQPGKSWIPYTSYGYFGGSIGRTYYDGGCFPGLTCDDKATGLKLYTGGKFSRYLGVELGYVHLGEADRNGGDVRAQGVNLSLVGSIPVSDQFSVFGKIGGIYGWTKVTSPVPGLPTGRDDGLGLSYGAGVQFDLNRKLALRADWDRYRLKYAGSQRDEADLYSVGIVVKF